MLQELTMSFLESSLWLIVGSGATDDGCVI